MKDIKILVATHKIFDTSILPKGYQPIKLGTGIDDNVALENGYWLDNIKDNIARENPWYCELTAQYWAWKNLKCDICGLVHYRRFFVDYHVNSTQIKEDILSMKDIENILSKYKIIVPYFGIKSNDTMTLHKGIDKDKDNRDWIIFESLISKYYPDLLPSFNEIVYGVKSWGLNMIITSKQIYDSYSEFLFDILQKWDQELSARGIQRRPRVDGFYSESLMPIWVMANFKENEIYRLEVQNTDVENEKLYGSSLKAKIKKSIKSIHWINNILHKIKISLKKVSVDDLKHEEI